MRFRCFANVKTHLLNIHAFDSKPGYFTVNGRPDRSFTDALESRLESNKKREKKTEENERKKEREIKKKKETGRLSARIDKRARTVT